jgi:hypothetical protein
MEFIRWRTQSLNDKHKPIGLVTYNAMFKLDKYDREYLDESVVELVKDAQKEYVAMGVIDKEDDSLHMFVDSEDEAKFKVECWSMFGRLLGLNPIQCDMASDIFNN